MNYEPIADNVLLKETPPHRMPELYRCEVVAVGKGFPMTTGICPMTVKVGDEVLVSRGSYISLHIEGEGSFFLIREHKIRLRITPEPKSG